MPDSRRTLLESMQNTNTSIVIPTYDERDNVLELLEQIRCSMQSAGYAFEIVIVDDDSPDETWKVASQCADRYPVRVIRRRGERGLATAVLKGIEASASDTIVVMDADLQHPPEKVPELVSCVRSGTDIAIGSRFVEHGAVGEFSLLRRITSKSAGILARTMFRRLRGIKDIESGFFALNKDVVAHARLKPVGYKVLLEILVQGDYATVSEIGYTFDKREAGVSKLGIRNVVSYARHISSLFYRSGEFHRFARFCTVGGIGAVLNLATLYWLTQLGMYYLLAGAIAIEVGLLSNFALNKSWTFKDRGVKGVRYAVSALGRDHVVRLVGIALNLAVLWLLSGLFGLYYLTSQLIGLIIAMVWNYGGNQWWTWEAT